MKMCCIWRDMPNLYPLHQSAYLCFLTPNNRMGPCQEHIVRISCVPTLNSSLPVPSDQQRWIAREEVRVLIPLLPEDLSPNQVLCQ